uniref:Uncharacterized protein n=1 Tax=Romanomermis culicivorax TaxID=13658 RepID=A0A915JBX9_ROMCU
MDERHSRNHADSRSRLFTMQAIIKNEILKLLLKSNNIEINLICEQDWIKCDGMFELELIEW